MLATSNVSTFTNNDVAPGAVVQASDHNSQGAALAAVLNGGIDNSNIAPNAAIDGSKLADDSITNAKLSTTAGEPGSVWQAWTPTLSGRFTSGDWTLTECKYIQIGKTVFFKLVIVASDATPMGGGAGEATFTLPVTSVALANAGLQIGTGRLRDANGSLVNCTVVHASTTTAAIKYSAVSGSLVIEGSLSSSAPFTWTTNDGVLVEGFYEVP